MNPEYIDLTLDDDDNRDENRDNDNNTTYNRNDNDFTTCNNGTTNTYNIRIIDTFSLGEERTNDILILKKRKSGCWYIAPKTGKRYLRQNTEETSSTNQEQMSTEDESSSVARERRNVNPSTSFQNGLALREDNYSTTIQETSNRVTPNTRNDSNFIQNVIEENSGVSNVNEMCIEDAAAQDIVSNQLSSTYLDYKNPVPSTSRQTKENKNELIQVVLRMIRREISGSDSDDSNDTIGHTHLILSTLSRKNVDNIMAAFKKREKYVSPFPFRPILSNPYKQRDSCAVTGTIRRDPEFEPNESYASRWIDNEISRDRGLMQIFNSFRNENGPIRRNIARIGRLNDRRSNDASFNRHSRTFNGAFFNRQINDRSSQRRVENRSSWNEIHLRVQNQSSVTNPQVQEVVRQINNSTVPHNSISGSNRQAANDSIAMNSTGAQQSSSETNQQADNDRPINNVIVYQSYSVPNRQAVLNNIPVNGIRSQEQSTGTIRQSLELIRPMNDSTGAESLNSTLINNVLRNRRTQESDDNSSRTPSNDNFSLDEFLAEHVRRYIP